MATIEYTKEEEQFVRRLGAAVVGLWAELPPALKPKIVKSAAHALDGENHAHLQHAIEKFITRFQPPKAS